MFTHRLLYMSTKLRYIKNELLQGGSYDSDRDLS